MAPVRFIVELSEGLKSTYLRNQLIGKSGEILTYCYLISKGHRILARNWRSQQGELDIVTIQNQSLNFIEVKTSWKHNPNYPNTLRVDLDKQLRIKKLAEEFCFKERKSFVKYSIRSRSFQIYSIYLSSILSTKVVPIIKNSHF